ncbi:MAG: GNAT family N-acetyltransferase [Acidobacteria bacterium]|nr:GNAT family N-acetyltransferase [Acidobacteriota bacterium]MBK8813585.1 GNAT family N-acetyltransferase [Acidobacteriota bacterium]
MKFEFLIELLDKNHKREDFDCGEESLNVFLKRFARQNSAKGFGRNFVAVLPAQTKVLGYYTISSGSVAFDALPENAPRYPIPTAHLGRLATDLTMRGQGLGELLLIDALARIATIADELGIYAVELFALNENAKKFYLRYGFTALIDDEKHLYLPVATLKKSGLV